MDDKHINKLDACWKGEKCVICTFSLDQIEFNEIVETEGGYAHESCLKDEEVSEENNNKLL